MMTLGGFAGTLKWPVNVTTLQQVSENEKLPLLVKVLKTSYPQDDNIRQEQLLYIYKIHRDRRVVCEQVDGDALWSIPFDYTQHEVEVLPESDEKGITPYELSADTRALWLKADHSDCAFLKEQTSVFYAGTSFKDHRADKIVLKNTVGDIFFLDQDSRTTFQVLQDGSPMSIQEAINRYSLPLTFQISGHKNLACEHLSYFRAQIDDGNNRQKNLDSIMPLRVVQIIESKYLIAREVNQQSGHLENSSRKILSPFTFDTQVLVATNFEDSNQLRYDALFRDSRPLPRENSFEESMYPIQEPGIDYSLVTPRKTPEHIDGILSHSSGAISNSWTLPQRVKLVPRTDDVVDEHN